MKRENAASSPEPTALRGITVLTSQEMPNGTSVRREVVLGERLIRIEGLSRKGTSYVGEKPASEDACVVIKNNTAIAAFVVDGGTQMEKIPTLDAVGLTGGRYIAKMVERFAQRLNPVVSVTNNLLNLNAAIGEDISANHPSVTYQEHSHDTPYGSIAAVKVDTQHNTLEVVNAGDVFVVAVDHNGDPRLLTVDDVYDKDQATFATTRRLADTYKLPFRHIMQQRSNDLRFRPVVQETEETMRQGNIGMIRRITGAPNFDVTSSMMMSLADIRAVYLFTDGGVLPDSPIGTPDGQYAFLQIVEYTGVQGLNEEVKKKMAKDPDFELYPRFGSLDDLLILKIEM